MNLEMAGRKKKLWRTVIEVAWTVFSLVLWVGSQWYFMSSTMTKEAETLVSMCEERERMIQEQFAVSVNHAHALAILVSTFYYGKDPPALDQETFAYYTAKTFFERPLINGVAYAERVVHSQRALFEHRQGWTIQTMKREPAPMQDEYAPVIYSQETVSYIGAVDMMSGVDDRENILRSRATGKAVLTKPFKLMSDHLGVVLTLPVYRSDLPGDATVEQRVEATAGYLGGAFDVESLVENLLKQLATNQNILVNVYDVTNFSEPLIMYGLQNPDGYMPLSRVSMLDFGDPFRKHQMVCRYREKPPIQYSDVFLPLGIFLIFMLVGHTFFAAWNRYDTVIEDCRKMQELKVQAEAADVAKSQFLATVSHEIRTPMNGVLGMLDMLIDTDLNLTQKDYAQTAQVCGKALILLINEVLDRAKIEAGKLEIEAVPFDLRPVLDDVLSFFSSKSIEKRIELAVFVSDKVPEVVIGDPGRFRQIITNLVGNSIKFTEHGHIFVRVNVVENPNIIMDVQVEKCLNGLSDRIAVADDSSDTLSGLKAADDRNCWENFRQFLSDEISLPDISRCNPYEKNSGNVTLMVTVEDTGIGIPIHAQDRVFMPFMQADSSTSRNYGGTGIGLSISKCLVELMGGQINFISKPQVGSTFAFTAVFKQWSKSADGGIKKTPSELLPTSFKGMKAYVIDGRPVRSAVTQYHLKRLGITVEVSCSFKMVLDAASGQIVCSMPWKQPYVVLIEKDSWISEMDDNLHNQLQQSKQKNQMKIVLLVTTEYDRSKSNSHIDTVIVKPLRASTVVACLQQVLGVEKQERKDLSNVSVSLHSLLTGKSILVVDDNRVNLRVAAAALKKYGAKVECALSGKEALALLQFPHRFDACFMDVQMPEMDGFEATRQIRMVECKANEQIRNTGDTSLQDASGRTEWHLPILAMTADVIQATYEECTKCGMDGYVSKPFEEQQLYQALAKFFDSNSNSDS